MIIVKEIPEAAVAYYNIAFMVMDVLIFRELNDI